MKVKDIFDEYGVNYYEAGSPNTSEGWISLRCVWCFDKSNHLGLNLESDRFHCWKCGKHDTVETLMEILSVSKKQALKLLGKFNPRRREVKEEKLVRTYNKVLFPSNLNKELLPVFKDYLHSRGFKNPDKLARKWNIWCTGKNSVLGDSDYSKRLIFPIFWNKEIVSWQSRKITGKGIKYKACKKEYEKIHHQHIFFNNRDYDGTTCIITEGVFDALKVGKKAIATFGTGVTREQIRSIAGKYTKAFILFDRENTAQIEARKLAKELNFRGVVTRNIDMKEFTDAKDPGDMGEAALSYMERRLIK